jgi:hypothetical protein
VPRNPIKIASKCNYLAQDVSETCESCGENTIIELIADCQDDGERSRRKRNVSPLATVGVDIEMQIEMFDDQSDFCALSGGAEPFQPTMRLLKVSERNDGRKNKSVSEVAFVMTNPSERREEKEIHAKARKELKLVSCSRREGSPRRNASSHV